LQVITATSLQQDRLSHQRASNLGSLSRWWCLPQATWHTGYIHATITSVSFSKNVPVHIL